jgi:hypothetical protein
MARPGLSDNRYRTYDPFSGTYLQVDAAVDQTWTPYVYAEHNPVSNTDSTGRDLDDKWYENLAGCIVWQFGVAGLCGAGAHPAVCGILGTAAELAIWEEYCRPFSTQVLNWLWEKTGSCVNGDVWWYQPGYGSWGGHQGPAFTSYPICCFDPSDHNPLCCDLNAYAQEHPTEISRMCDRDHRGDASAPAGGRNAVVQGSSGGGQGGGGQVGRKWVQ